MLFVFLAVDFYVVDFNNYWYLALLAMVSNDTDSYGILGTIALFAWFWFALLPYLTLLP